MGSRSLLCVDEVCMFGMRDLEEERERRENMATSEVTMKGNCVNGKGETNDAVGDGQQNGSSSTSSGRGNVT